VDAVTLRVWNARRRLREQRIPALRRTLALLAGAIALCGLGMYALCDAPAWGIGRGPAALSEFVWQNVTGAVVLPTIAVAGGWIAPLPLLYSAKPHNRAPAMCVWELEMWRFHTPWMLICVMGPIFGAFVAAPSVTGLYQIIVAFMMFLAWGGVCLVSAVLWVQAVKRRVHEASLLHTAPGVWLILWGVPMFLCAGMLGFFAGMFAAARSIELWGQPGLFMD
jgi:hypothetical protein